VVIPNGVLMRNKFTILGRRAGQPQQWRRWIWFSVEFAVSPQRVIDAVEQALARAQIAHVARTPTPNCLTMDIDDSVVKYALRYWLTDLSADDPTDSAVRGCVYAALRRAGIHFAAPEQTVHLIKQGDKHALRAQERDLDQRVGIVNQIELFASLSPDERREIAQRLVYTPFAAGETITQQGAVAHWLYLLVQGSVEVVVDSAAGERRKLARIDTAAGAAFFGEMGLLTGAPRAATVIAGSEADCYRLDKHAFEGVLRRRPAIADEIAQIVARRRSDLELLQGDLEKAAQARTLRDGRQELLARIRNFFGLNEGGGRPA
jgi:CRP-like cAMP-binding protein